MFPLDYIGGRKFILAIFVIALLACLLRVGLIDAAFMKEIVLVVVSYFFGVNSAEKNMK